jgi:hypothetical protein
MTALLETVADQTLRHMEGLTEAIRDEIHSRKDSPDDRRLRAELSAARYINRQVAAFVETAEESKTEAEDLLRRGLSWSDFQILARLGSHLLRGGLTFLSDAEQLWNQLEEAGAAADDVRAARETLSTSGDRLTEFGHWVDRLTKLAGRKPPEIEPKRMEQGVEEIRQGRFQTGERLRQSTRKASQ